MDFLFVCFFGCEPRTPFFTHQTCTPSNTSGVSRCVHFRESESPSNPEAIQVQFLLIERLEEWYTADDFRVSCTAAHYRRHLLHAFMACCACLRSIRVLPFTYLSWFGTGFVALERHCSNLR